MLADVHNVKKFNKRTEYRTAKQMLINLSVYLILRTNNLSRIV